MVCGFPHILKPFHWYLQLAVVERVVNSSNPESYASCSSAASKGKDKVYPRTGHEGPEGEQMCSSTLPSTLAVDGGGWSTPCPGRFTPEKDPVPIV